MVGRVKCRTNRAILSDSISFYVAPRRIRNEVMKTKYLETNLSAAQLGEEFGLSKQAALGHFEAGVHGINAGKGINKESNQKDVQEKKRHEEEDRLEER